MTLLRLNYSFHAKRDTCNDDTEYQGQHDAIDKLAEVEAIVPVTCKTFRTRQDHEAGT